MQTKRLRMGVMVTGNTYRHPAVLAHMGATVDIISHGRLDFGIGAGWNETEHTMHGIPLYTPAERIHRLDEACEIIRLLRTEPDATSTDATTSSHEAAANPSRSRDPTRPS